MHDNTELCMRYRLSLDAHVQVNTSLSGKWGSKPSVHNLAATASESDALCLCKASAAMVIGYQS